MKNFFENQFRINHQQLFLKIPTSCADEQHSSIISWLTSQKAEGSLIKTCWANVISSAFVFLLLTHENLKLRFHGDEREYSRQAFFFKCAWEENYTYKNSKAKTCGNRKTNDILELFALVILACMPIPMQEKLLQIYWILKKYRSIK